MSKFPYGLTLVALCLALGSLPAMGASVAPLGAPAEPRAESRPELGTDHTTDHTTGRQAGMESETRQTGAQDASADSQPAEPETSRDTPKTEQPESAASKTAQPKNTQDGEGSRVLPPLRELITSPYGNRRMPGWLSRRGMVMRDHGGIDIRARIGWPVTAFKPGTVIRAGENGPLGISVDVRQDDGMTARYGHMSKTLVTSGQRVTAGEPVGLVGCTGRTTGAHLHFGLLDASGKTVDPMPYLHSADEVLRPDPADIPPVIEAQSCGPVLRGPNGRPARMGTTLKNLDSYTPPPIPTWNERR